MPRVCVTPALPEKNIVQLHGDEAKFDTGSETIGSKMAAFYL